MRVFCDRCQVTVESGSECPRCGQVLTRIDKDFTQDVFGKVAMTGAGLGAVAVLAAVLVIILALGYRGDSSSLGSELDVPLVNQLAVAEAEKHREQPQSPIAENDRERVVLVAFGAKWCGPCRHLDPELDFVRKGLTGKILIVHVDIDQHRDFARQCHVESIPCMVLFKGRKEISRRVGYSDRNDLRFWLNRFI